MSTARKGLARHSSITLTMDHYAHSLVEDERRALDRLPSFRPVPDDEEECAETGTDGPECLVLSLVETRGSDETTCDTPRDDSELIAAQP